MQKICFGHNDSGIKEEDINGYVIVIYNCNWFLGNVIEKMCLKRSPGELPFAPWAGKVIFLPGQKGCSLCFS